MSRARVLPASECGRRRRMRQLDQTLGKGERIMRLHWTAPILSAAALLVACDRGAMPTGARPQAELGVQTATDLIEQLLLKFEPVSDGTLTPDDPLPFGHTIHVV